MRENKGEIERVSFLPESSLAGVFYSVSVHVGVSLDVAERQMARIAAVDGCMRVGRQELRKRASERVLLPVGITHVYTSCPASRRRPIVPGDRKPCVYMGIRSRC